MIRIRNSSWTLEKELCKVARCTNVGHALYTLGLLSTPSSKFKLISSKWERGGAETYLDRFQFLIRDQIPVDILIKACVTFTPGADLDSILDEWVDRRRLLSENGVKTPRLYGSGYGVLIEEFVPYELRTVLTSGGEKPAKVLDELARYAATLSRLGFSPVDPFKDLRSHGDDIVVVDFGRDLGPPGIMSGPQPIIFQRLRQYLMSLGIRLHSAEYDRLRCQFAVQGGEFLQ